MLTFLSINVIPQIAKRPNSLFTVRSQHALLLLVRLEQFVFSPWSPFKECVCVCVSVVVTVGEQVLKTSSSCITGLCQALIEQTVQTDRQIDRQENRSTGTFLHNSYNEIIHRIFYAVVHNMFFFCPGRPALHKQGLLCFGAHSMFVNISLDYGSTMGQNTPWSLFVQLKPIHTERERVSYKFCEACHFSLLFSAFDVIFLKFTKKIIWKLVLHVYK